MTAAARGAAERELARMARKHAALVAAHGGRLGGAELGPLDRGARRRRGGAPGWGPRAPTSRPGCASATPEACCARRPRSSARRWSAGCARAAPRGAWAAPAWLEPYRRPGGRARLERADRVGDEPPGGDVRRVVPAQRVDGQRGGAARRRAAVRPAPPRASASRLTQRAAGALARPLAPVAEPAPAREDPGAGHPLVHHHEPGVERPLGEVERRGVGAEAVQARPKPAELEEAIAVDGDEQERAVDRRVALGVAEARAHQRRVRPPRAGER